MMTATVRCPNSACGRISQLGEDPLGRVFRCSGCFSRLPTAPASAGHSTWTSISRCVSTPTIAWRPVVTARCAERADFQPAFGSPGICPAPEMGWEDHGLINLESGEILIGPADWDCDEIIQQEASRRLVPADSSEVFVEPLSLPDRLVSALASTTTASMAAVLSEHHNAKSSRTHMSVEHEERFGRFLIRSILGEGKHAKVFRAYDPILERDVALKVRRDVGSHTAKALERFLGEARALAQLQHPRIVSVHEAGCADDRYYIAMALIEGSNLADRLSQGPFVPQRATEIVADLADALAYAHNLGIVHRDVKPANVRLDCRGAAYLMDFGIAYRPDSGELPLPPGKLLGTPAYMAPEQAQGGLSAALPASDQYSLGSVLYEMLCGRPPFSGPPPYVIFHTIHRAPPSPHKLVSKVPRALSAICLKALQKSPDRRYGDCREFAADLRRWLQGQTPLACRRSWKVLGN
jgi:eukaryotic-like serine/threonine-protein kinase